MQKIRELFKFLNIHKLKLLTMILSIFVFSFQLFPYNDLSDFFSVQVAKFTNNSVYLQFDSLRLSLFPTTGVAVTDVHVEARGFPALKAREIVISPSISSLIMKKPAGSFFAKGLLNGDIEISIKPGAKSDEKKIERQSITVSVKKVSLEELRDLFGLPMAIKGKLNLNSEALVDFNFAEQPDAEITLKIQDFILPPSNIPTQIGPLAVTGFKLSSVELKGRLSAGRFEIGEGIVGAEGDEIKGTIRGGIGLQIRNQGPTISPAFSAYNFDVKLSIKKSLQEREKLLLQFLEQFKTPGGMDADVFSIRISGQDTFGPPTMGALR